MKLQRLRIRHYDDIIHDQGKAWLREKFSSGSRKFPVNVSALVRNIIWQTRERVMADEREPLTELIRTFWYSHIKPTLSRAGALSEETDQYNVLVEQLVTLVRDEKLMKYSDIGFRDDNQANRQVGLNPHVIIFAEKVGHYDYLIELANLYGVSTIALGGQPSALSVEYFVDQMREKGVNLRRSFFLFSIVDFDSSGWSIRDSFIKNLKAFGVSHIKNVDLITPDMLTPDEIRFSRYPIRDKKSTRKKNTAWLREVRRHKFKNQKVIIPPSTKSRRKVYGLEAESISAKRLSARLEKLVPPLLGKSERLLSIHQLDRLTESIKELIIFKITGR